MAIKSALSFTSKKEYIEWIITAKREETRKKRLQITLDKLLQEWKNPRNL
ncbi:MAG: YdeI/OmpD-associated family protein [Chitinophagaceae bacterium]|nr:YdeI/OmpD-associated family protein [Chitinophagaceae bacterium]